MIEVWKQMLEVLEYWDVHGGVHQPTEEAIQAGKKAIAELESQEPLGYIASMALNDMRDGIYGEVRVYHEDLGGSVPIYTTPPQRTWVGLTDEDVFAVLEKLQNMYHRPPSAIFAQAIEAKLKEKNT
jgi:hypothetical protein